MEKRKERLNKKGFTLVELIIVMAIMAILVGALAPRVMGYVERSRESRDLQLVNTVFTAVSTAIASYDGNNTIPDHGTLSQYITAVPEIAQLLGANLDSDAEVIDNCVSRIGSSATAVTIDYDDTTQAISVNIGTIGPVTN